MKLENRYLCDWLTFTSKIHSPKDIADLLGIDFNKFEFCNFGLKSMRYTNMYQFGNIYILFGGINEGICLSMSGQGCRTFEKYGNGDWFRLFSIILSNSNIDKKLAKMNCTRLDVAYDIFDGSLDIWKCIEYRNNGNYVSRCSHKYVNCSFNAYRNGLNVIHDNASLTIGRRSSDLQIRIYDKKDEQQKDKNIDLFVYNDKEYRISELNNGWVRCELQLRDGNAYGFVYELIHNMIEIDELFHSVINNNFRFVEPCEDSNIRRWDMATFWADFLQSFNIRHILQKAPQTYTIEKLDSYVLDQACNAVVTAIDIHGLNYMLAQFALHRKKTKSKYRDLISQHGIAPDSLENILENEIDFENAVNDISDFIEVVPDSNYENGFMWGLDDPDYSTCYNVN